MEFLDPVSSSALIRLSCVRSHLATSVIRYLESALRQSGGLTALLPSELRTGPAAENAFDIVYQSGTVIERTAKPANRHADSTPPSGILEREKPLPSFKWSSLTFSRFPRCVLLADSGYGKSSLLIYEFRRGCRAALKGLTDHGQSVGMIRLPIMLSASQLARELAPARSMHDALIACIRSSFNADSSFPTAFYEWVRKKLESGLADLLIDAIDEVPGGSRQELRARLVSYFDTAPASLRTILSSRLVGYPGLPFANRSLGTELQLQPLDDDQIEALSRTWFGVDKNDGHVRLQRAIENNVKLAELIRIPLFLTLLCRATKANQVESPNDLRRVDIYELSVRALFAERSSAGEGYIDHLLDDILRPLASQLYVEGHGQFEEKTLSDLLSAQLKSLPTEHPVRRFLRNSDVIALAKDAQSGGRLIHPDEVLAVLQSDASAFPYSEADRLVMEFKRAGLLVATSGGANPLFAFIHRGVFEFLAAGQLARQFQNDYTALEFGVAPEIKDLESSKSIANLLAHKAWLDDWQEIIVLTIGQLANPLPLLQILFCSGSHMELSIRDDIARHRRTLACQALLEIPANIRDGLGDYLEILANEIFDEWWLNFSRCVFRRDNLEKSVRVLAALNVLWHGDPIVNRLERFLKGTSAEQYNAAFAIYSGAIPQIPSTIPVDLFRLALNDRDGEYSIYFLALEQIARSSPHAQRDNVLLETVLDHLMLDYSLYTCTESGVTSVDNDNDKKINLALVFINALKPIQLPEQVIDRLLELFHREHLGDSYVPDILGSLINPPKRETIIAGLLPDLGTSGEGGEDAARQASQAIIRLGGLSIAAEYFADLEDRLADDRYFKRLAAVRYVALVCPEEQVTYSLLERIIDSYTTLKNRPNGDLFSAVLTVLSRYKFVDITSTLLSKLARCLSSSDKGHHLFALEVISTIGPSALPAASLHLIVQCLCSKDYYIRKATYEVIELIASRNSYSDLLDPILDRLNDLDPDVKSSVICDLISFG
jgi:hypothetical protein